MKFTRVLREKLRLPVLLPALPRRSASSALRAPVFFEQWRDVPAGAFRERWPDFTPVEIACRGDGSVYVDPDSMDAIQRCRTRLGQPLRVSSAHRSAAHNAYVGGAPLSAHRKLAFDVRIDGHDPVILYQSLKEAGFRSFGFYVDNSATPLFIHADLRPGRLWFGNRVARQIWSALLAGRW